MLRRTFLRTAGSAALVSGLAVPLALAARGRLAREPLEAPRPPSGVDLSPLEPGPLDAQRVLQALLAKYPIVALAKAHGCSEEHALIAALLKDPALPNLINDIVVEWGNQAYQPVMDSYLLDGAPISRDELRGAWQDTT